MARPVFHSQSTCEECGVTGDDFMSPSVEAWEVTGKLVCEDCADAVLEAHAEQEAEDDCCPGCGACPGFTGVECDETCEWATTGGGAE